MKALWGICFIMSSSLGIAEGTGQLQKYSTEGYVKEKDDTPGLKPNINKAVPPNPAKNTERVEPLCVHCAGSAADRMRAQDTRRGQVLGSPYPTPMPNNER